jgi:hypothetical protein
MFAINELMKLSGSIVIILMIFILMFSFIQVTNSNFLAQLPTRALDYVLLGTILILGLPWALLSKKENHNRSDGFDNTIFESLPRIVKVATVLGVFGILYIFWFH